MPLALLKKYTPGVYGIFMALPLELLAYYDTLDRPLSIDEIGADVCMPFVGKRDGYYYLFDREYLVPLRKERERIAARKWRVMREVMFWMRMVPFVRVVFASGSLSINNTDELSDLDVVIVARHGCIWTTRFLVAGLLALLGRRRKHEDLVAPDKICPNHFITDQSLHIPFHSMYTAKLYANLVPLMAVDHDDLKKFHEANSWVLGFVGRWKMREDQIVQQGLSFAIQWMGELILGLFGRKIENAVARYQKRRIGNKTNNIYLGGHLTFTDNALAFHSRSSESKILAQYENNKSKLASRPRRSN